MSQWACDEYSLTLLHIEPGFHTDIVNDLRPWLRLTSDVRRQVFINATDPTRKDQWMWMKRFEKMLTDRYGAKASFLPNDEEKASEPSRKERKPAKPSVEHGGIIYVRRRDEGGAAQAGSG